MWKALIFDQMSMFRFKWHLSGSFCIVLCPIMNKQVAQRATIALLSPMCQGKILFKKTTEKKWKHHFPHYKSMGVFLRRSRAANSVVGGPIWQKFEFIRNIMHVLVTSKFEKDRININGDYVMTSIF